jgi:hypothetical protein
VAPSGEVSYTGNARAPGPLRALHGVTMKRSQRILMLRRETLRQLTELRDADLARVGGGAPTSKKNVIAFDSDDCDTLGATSRYC